MFYNVFEFKVLLRKLIDYKLRITHHHEMCPGKVEHSSNCDWPIFHQMPERDHLVSPSQPQQEM